MEAGSGALGSVSTASVGPRLLRIGAWVGGVALVLVVLNLLW